MRHTYLQNIRICSIIMSFMLIVGLLPTMTMQQASAAATPTVYAAAYMGASTAAGTTLPGSIDIEGESANVNWHIGVDTFAVPYETVTVTGTADGGIPVMAQVEVIPPADHPLKYFVDSGRAGDSNNNDPSASPLHAAVKELSLIHI